MATHSVTVTRTDPNGNELTLTPSTIDLSPGDSVEWSFPELGPSESAYILFDASEFPFGPFPGLQVPGSFVTGQDNSGLPGIYTYTAMILDDEEGPVATGEGSVVNPVPEGTLPVATVFFDGTNLSVIPVELALQTQQTAFWLIQPLPEGHFITFHFGFGGGPLEPELFSSFTITAGPGGSQIAIGSSISGPDDDVPSPVHYQIILHGPGGLQVKKDPVIDRLGWPPTGPATAT